MRCFLKPKNDALKGAKKALKLKKSGLKPKNDALKTKGNAQKVTLKIHSLANFTTLKYLLTDAKCNSTPWKGYSHQPRAERTQAGERHPGGDVHPERTPPRRGQKPIPFCFLLLLLQSAIHADGLPRVSARFAHLALGLAAHCPPLGRTVRAGFVQRSEVLKFRSSDVLMF